MSKSKILNLLSLLLVIVLLAGCGARPTKGDVVVYVSVPLSGWQADGGQTVVGGARLAAARLNESGGILGYRVVIKALDDEADSEIAAQVANQVAQTVRGGENVLGLIGHYNSGQSAAGLEVYKDLPLIVISPTASSPELTEMGYRNFFRVCSTDASQGPYDATFMVNELGAKRIVLLYANNGYGRGLKDQMVPALKALGIEPVAIIEIEEGAPTHAAVMPTIVAAEPDVVFLAGYETEGYVVLPEIREAGIMAPFMCSDGCLPYDFVDGSGKWAEGAYISGIAPDSQIVEEPAWYREYQEIEARNPGTHSAVGYAAMMVMAEAAKQAKSLDTDLVISAMHQMQYSSIIGPIAFDENGDLAQQNIYVFQIQDGEYVQIEP